MTDHAPRRSRDLNQMYSSNQLTTSQYPNGNNINYLNNGGHVHYSHMNTIYPNYSVPFVPSQNIPNGLMYSTSHQMPMSYQAQPLRGNPLPSQPRTHPHSPYYSSSIQTHRHHTQQAPRYISVQEISLADTEDQESTNQDSMRSEPINPPLDGFPSVTDFDELMKHYVSNLSPKKQDKALIHAKRAANIKAVLIDKKTTSVESAQFRFWVKKMFTLHPNDPSIPGRKKKICHENKPVAIREKLFKILTKAHRQCQHGGRDKTSAQVRRVYSWVPKELISRFVKICPTCQIRRGTSRNSPPESDKSPENYMDMESPLISSPTHSQRDSLVTNSSAMQSPLQMAGFSANFQQQNRWMTTDKVDDRVAKLEMAATAMSNGHNNLGYAELSGPQTKEVSYSSVADPMHGVEAANNAYYHHAMSEVSGYHTSDARHRFKREHHFKQERRY